MRTITRGPQMALLDDSAIKREYHSETGFRLHILNSLINEVVVEAKGDRMVAIYDRDEDGWFGYLYFFNRERLIAAHSIDRAVIGMWVDENDEDRSLIWEKPRW